MGRDFKSVEMTLMEGVGRAKSCLDSLVLSLVIREVVSSSPGQARDDSVDYNDHKQHS